MYKEISDGELCLLQHEVDQTELLIDKVMSNKVCEELIRGSNVEYEVPGICLLYTSPSPRDRTRSRMPSSA